MALWLVTVTACGEDNTQPPPRPELASDSGLVETNGDVNNATSMADTPLEMGNIDGSSETVDSGSDDAPPNDTDIPPVEDSSPPAPDVPELAPEVLSYCDCMFISCHDLYHEIWGEDELEARQGCIDEATALPLTGEPAEVGDSLDCRLLHCQLMECTSGGGLELCVE